MHSFDEIQGVAGLDSGTSCNIQSGWSKTGLYPFNPERVLKDIQKPAVELYLAQNVDTEVEQPLLSATLQTPGTSNALTLLWSRIEHDIHMLDGQGKRRL